MAIEPMGVGGRVQARGAVTMRAKASIRVGDVVRVTDSGSAASGLMGAVRRVTSSGDLAWVDMFDAAPPALVSFPAGDHRHGWIRFELGQLARVSFPFEGRSR